MRDDIEAGLARGGSLPAGVRLEADSVEVSLALDNTGAAPVVGPSGATPSGHTITVRFKVRHPSPTESPETPRTLPVPTLNEIATGTARSSIEEACIEIFGPPGFDNAARAEVFSELAGVEATATLQEALRLVISDTRPSSDSPLSDVARRLRQLLGFSPAGTTAAATRLLELLNGHPKEEIRRVLSELWQFGTHWA